jgi:hypothetical protein
MVFSPSRLKKSFVGYLFLVGSYFLLELGLYCSMLSWLLGFMLRVLRYFFLCKLAFFSGSF